MIKCDNLYGNKPEVLEPVCVEIKKKKRMVNLESVNEEMFMQMIK